MNTQIEERNLLDAEVDQIIHEETGETTDIEITHMKETQTIRETLIRIQIGRI